jgi:hypothetical protein
VSHQWSSEEKTIKDTEINDSLLRVPFSVNQKLKNSCVDRAAYFFLFCGRAADNREQSEH